MNLPETQSLFVDARTWKSTSATVDRNGKRLTATIPLDATTWMLAVTNSRGAIFRKHSCVIVSINRYLPARRGFASRYLETTRPSCAPTVR